MSVLARLMAKSNHFAIYSSANRSAMCLVHQCFDVLGALDGAPDHASTSLSSALAAGYMKPIQSMLSTLHATLVDQLSNLWGAYLATYIPI